MVWSDCNVMPLLLSCAGTVAYMAPEVLQKGAMAMPADVYSFAMLMLELWTGEIVYSGINSHQVALRQTLPCSSATAKATLSHYIKQHAAHQVKACCAQSSCAQRNCKWPRMAGPALGQLSGPLLVLSGHRSPCVVHILGHERNDRAAPELGFRIRRCCSRCSPGRSRPCRTTCRPAYRALLGQCWATDPAARPKIQAVLPQLCTMLEELRTQQATLF